MSRPRSWYLGRMPEEEPSCESCGWYSDGTDETQRNLIEFPLPHGAGRFWICEDCILRHWEVRTVGGRTAPLAEFLRGTHHEESEQGQWNLDDRTKSARRFEQLRSEIVWDDWFEGPDPTRRGSISPRVPAEGHARRLDLLLRRWPFLVDPEARHRSTERVTGGRPYRDGTRHRKAGLINGEEAMLLDSLFYAGFSPADITRILDGEKIPVPTKGWLIPKGGWAP